MYKRQLIDNGISFVTKSNGTYISQINGLAELDNGKNSGWMYTVNGKSVSQLYSERTLSEGDVIEWFYTDAVSYTHLLKNVKENGTYDDLVKKWFESDESVAE